MACRAEGTGAERSTSARLSYKDQFTGFGMSDAMAQGMLDMMIAKDHGLDSGVTRTPQNAIDSPATFRQWCEDTLKPAVLGA